MLHFESFHMCAVFLEENKGPKQKIIPTPLTHANGEFDEYNK
jgi:hypothetical protein